MYFIRRIEASYPRSLQTGFLENEVKSLIWINAAHASTGSGNKSAIQERRTIAIDDSTAPVTKFYEFTRMQEGRPYQGHRALRC